jgi:hypothetical protein
MVPAVVFETALTYPAYRKMLDELMGQQKTTGPDQSEKMVQYARLNLQRMNRLEKTAALLPELQAVIQGISKPQHWLVITEGWCGDAAQNLPVIAQAAALNPKIELKLILRDEHPAVMDRYLFNGTRSIPRLIIFNEAWTDLAVWGPRPQPAQEIVNAGKAQALPHDTWAEQVHVWYAKDRSVTLQRELIELIKGIA